MRTLAEKSVAQTRELCEHSLEAVLESWERFVDAGQGAVALNRKAIDIARHNINSGFGFAVSSTRAKNLAEIMELQAAYWRKQLGELAAQAGEIRTLSTKVTADAAAPIKGADSARHQRPTGNDLSRPKGPFRSNTELQGRKASAFHSTQRKSLHSIPHTCGGLEVHARPKTCRYH